MITVTPKAVEQLRTAWSIATEGSIARLSIECVAHIAKGGESKVPFETLDNLVWWLRDQQELMVDAIRLTEQVARAQGDKEEAACDYCSTSNLFPSGYCACV
jgi:hypothetical protein